MNLFIPFLGPLGPTKERIIIKIRKVYNNKDKTAWSVLERDSCAEESGVHV